MKGRDPLAGSNGDARSEIDGDPPPEIRHHLETLAELDSRAAQALEEALPELTRRLPYGALAHFVELGLETLVVHRQAGVSFFRLESAAAQDALTELETEVRLADQRRVLALFAEAVAGFPVPLAARSHTGGDAARSRLPSSDGATLFLPSEVHQFDSKRLNFLVYKAAILHHLGYYRCDTFVFDLDRFDARVDSDLVQAEPRDTRTSSLQRFFERFERPALARSLFGILEATRVDAFLLRRFRGFRPDLLALLSHGASSSRRAGSPLERLERFAVRRLIERFSDSPVASHDRAREGQKRAATDLDRLLAPDATVYDSARMTIELAAHFEHLEIDQTGASSDGQGALLARDSEDSEATLELDSSNSDSSDDRSLLYRGELDPELIQKRLELDQLVREMDALDPCAASVDAGWRIMDDRLGLLALQDGDLFGMTGVMQAELDDDTELERAEQPSIDRPPDDEQKRRSMEQLLEHARPLAQEIESALDRYSDPDRSFYYDEWDYEIDDYRRNWCRLSETVLEQGDIEFVDQTRHRHAALLEAVRRQFEMLRPEVLRRVRRLVDGEELDLDRAVEVLTDLRAGLPPNDDVYTRRNRQERDVAAVFLLDLSASTDTEVEEDTHDEPTASRIGEPELVGILDDSDPWEGLWGFPHVPSARPKRRRVVDVEKEAVVLMADALETLGDRYAVYGFSGYGRDRVDLFVAKEFDQAWSATTQRRLAAMEPYQSTRMGPAIRHCLEKLHAQDARVKVLLILSDGYPQDHDYGSLRGDRTYGLKDTMMALREAQLEGVHSFCLTVDPAGHDYLREMCPERSYLVIDDVESLPDELPKVYRGLTT